MFFSISQSFSLKLPQLAFYAALDAGLQAHKQTTIESAAIEAELKGIERWTCICAKRLCMTPSVR